MREPDPRPRLRILVVDDEDLARRALTALLATYPELEIVGQAADGVTAVELAVTVHPDVVVMDGIMPHLDGLGAATRIKRLAPDVAVLLLSLYGDLEWEARRCGADVFLMKSASTEEIVDCIHRLGRRAATARPASGQPLQGVTP
jgi:DNA-binding NarL/FixJ family response regulator